MSNSKVDLMMVIMRSLCDQGFPRKNWRVMGPRPMDLEISNSNIKAIRQQMGPKLEI